MTQKHLRVVARVIALPDKVEELKAVLVELVKETRKEKGCIIYDCLQNQKNPTDFTFVETWENQDYLDAHMATDHFQTAVKKLNGLVATEADIRLYDQLF